MHRLPLLSRILKKPFFSRPKSWRKRATRQADEQYEVVQDSQDAGSMDLGLESAEQDHGEPNYLSH